MRLIDADKLHVDKQINGECWISQEQIINAQTVEPQKMGKWVSTIVKEKGWNGKERQFYQPISCSVCRKPNHAESNYCPNCGAKMEVKGD